VKYLTAILGWARLNSKRSPWGLMACRLLRREP
jgi:hypothetical protein